MSFSLGEYQDIFLEEADELLQDLNKNLLDLEKNPEDAEIINNIFRAAHSLKSSAAFVGLNDLSDLAHKMENLLQGIRDKTNLITDDVVDIIFKCFDAINDIIEDVASGVAPTRELDSLIEKINKVNEESKVGAGGSVSEDKGGEKLSEGSDPGGKKPAPKMSFTSTESKIIREALSEGKKCFIVTVLIDSTAQMKWVKGQLISVNLEKEGSVVKIVPSIEDMCADESITSFNAVFITSYNTKDVYRLCDIDQVEEVTAREITSVIRNGKQLLKVNSPVLLEDESSKASAVEEAAVRVNNEPDFESAFENEAEHDESEDTEVHEDNIDHTDEAVASFDRRKNDQPVDNDRRKTPISKTVKVSVDKLDLLLNNVGELVIANSGFFRLYEEVKKYSQNKSIIGEFKNRMEQMSRIAKDLQTGIMKTRMVPIGQVFSRFNRLVRDLAKEHKKDVELVIKGEETELDKKVIDVIGEPLLHLIRNAVDHGIEPSEDRAKLGKSEKSTVILNAYQGGNQIFVEISDDGRGLDVQAIKSKVIEKNLSTPEILANMEDQDIYNFIFNPGFSTAKKITDISGRGVGMNVVKETVTELNGNVLIETEKGMGTRFVLSFPLTLAIIPAIMVKVRKEVYAIPLSDVIETIKISYEDIATIEGHEVINLRGEILSLLRLNEFVGLKTALRREEKIPVVVVGYGNRKIGLIVDFLEGKMEIVIKSLEHNYTNVEGLAGASILGDGSICLILDIQTMINRVITIQERLSQEEREKIIQIRSTEFEEIEPEDRSTGSTAGSFDIPVEDEDIEPEELNSQGPKHVSDVIMFNEEESEVQPEPENEDVGDVFSVEPDLIVSEPEITEDHSETEDANRVVEEEITEPAEISDLDDFESSVQDEDVNVNVNGTMPAGTTMMFDDIASDQQGEEDFSPIESDEPVLDEELNNILEDEIRADGEDVKDSGDDNVQSEELDQQVKGALQDFKDELKSNVSAVVGSGASDDHMNAELNISKEELNQFNLISNMGAATAAESLSRIIGKRIDLSIPEVKITPVEKIPEFIGNLNDPYMGVLLGIEGEVEGTLLLVLREEVGFELISLLYGEESSANKELSEDGVSALKELTNILGSSIINVYAEKAGLVVKPAVPTFVHDFLQSVMDSVLVLHSLSNEYAIVMETAFYFEDDQVMGNLMILPQAESLKVLVNGMRSNDE